MLFVTSVPFDASGLCYSLVGGRKYSENGVIEILWKRTERRLHSRGGNSKGPVL